jgi:hypothetical protein
MCERSKFIRLTHSYSKGKKTKFFEINDRVKVGAGCPGFGILWDAVMGFLIILKHGEICVQN